MTIVHPQYVSDDAFCLETMNADNLRGYDYGCAAANAAVLRVLDGKDTGVGVSDEPWETIRRRLLALLHDSFGVLLCELIECEALGPFSDVMPPALLERWQNACDEHIENTLAKGKMT